MKFANRPSWWIHTVAVLAVGVALLVRWLLGPVLKEEAPLLIFLGAVAFASWYGGFLAGLLATLLSAVVGVYSFLHPHPALEIDTPREGVRVLLFVGLGLFVAWLNHRLRATRRQAQDSAREALRRQEQLDREIAEHRRSEEALRESKERLQLALNTGMLGAWQLDLAGDNLTSSARCKANFGLDASEPFTWADFWRAVHADDRDQVRAALDRAAAEFSHYEVEFRCVWPDGSLHWIIGRGRALGDGRGRATRLVGVTLDVTERRQAEETLREANRRKDDFLATLAHELRNPLAAISNAVQLLSLIPEVPPAVADLRDVMTRQVHQLVRLIDDLLDVSRINRGKIDLRKERVPLASVVATALEASRIFIAEAGHQLSVRQAGEPLAVEADPARLAQVLTNLLNNAAKYTPPGGHIWLTTERQDDKAVVRVRDDGVGIPPGELAHIFEMFIQLEPPLERAHGGLGIGLTLVKSLVEMHGGHITAASAGPGQGSEFVVCLPLARPPSAAEIAPPPHAVGTDGQGFRVLVVDDSEPVAEMFTLLLRALGHEVQMALSGEAALEQVAVFRPEVVFSDISMPGMNGYELARRLRQQPDGHDLYLVAMTGYGQASDRVQALTAGFDRHLVKPADLEEVEALFATLAARRSAASTG